MIPSRTLPALTIALGSSKRLLVLDLSSALYFPVHQLPHSSPTLISSCPQRLAEALAHGGVSDVLDIRSMNEGVITQVMMIMKMMAAISEILPPARLMLSTSCNISLNPHSSSRKWYHDYPYFTLESTKSEKFIACPSSDTK